VTCWTVIGGSFIFLLMTGLTGLLIWFFTLYRNPYVLEEEVEGWKWVRRRKRFEPPEEIYLQFYQTGTPKVTWWTWRTHHDDVKYVRAKRESRTDKSTRRDRHREY